MSITVPGSNYTDSGINNECDFGTEPLRTPSTQPKKLAKIEGLPFSSKPSFRTPEEQLGEALPTNREYAFNVNSELLDYNFGEIDDWWERSTTSYCCSTTSYNMRIDSCEMTTVRITNFNSYSINISADQLVGECSILQSTTSTTVTAQAFVHKMSGGSSTIDESINFNLDHLTAFPQRCDTPRHNLAIGHTRQGMERIDVHLLGRHPKEDSVEEVELCRIPVSGLLLIHI